MNIKITNPLHGGTVHAISSKSEAQRLLVCAALADKETVIICPYVSEDIEAMANCLEELSAVVSYEHDRFFIKPIPRNVEKKEQYFLDCGESGTALRFLLPVCATLGLSVSINMHGRLPQRPLTVLYDEMVAHGCKLSEQGKSPLTCEGQLANGTYNIPGNISSQYISGLLLALPVLKDDSKINVIGNLESRPYVDITLDILKKFGINVSEDEQGFFIPGSQIGHSPKSLQVGGDWSNAAFWLVAGAIGRETITCTGLEQNSCQGDRAIIEILKQFGADVKCEDNSFTTSPSKLYGIDIDAKDIPDLVPILAALASVSEGKTTFHNARRLRIKESNRLQTTATMLSDLGADIKEDGDSLVVIGKNWLKGGITQSFGDHRIAMTAAIISAKCETPVIIQNAEAVRKSYINFFEDFAKLGGVYEQN